MSLLSLLGISSAYAADAAAPAHSAGGGLISILPMLIIFVIFIFFMMRPQMKRAKEHRALIAGLAVGDEVITAGGILGRVSKLYDNFVQIQVNTEVEIRLQRGSISQVLPKGTIDTIQ